MGDHDEHTAAFMKALGVEIRSWRLRRGLSREQLADEAGISASTMGRIEREGPVDVSHTWAIADVLNISLSALVARAEEAMNIESSAQRSDELESRRARKASEGARTVSERAVAKRRRSRVEDEDVNEP